MKADERPATTPPAPSGAHAAPAIAPPPPGPDDGPASVGEALAAFWATVRGAGLYNPRLFAAVGVVALVVGGWWYLSSSSRRAASELWTQFDRTSPAAYGKFAEEHPGTVAGKAALLAAARRQLQLEGLAAITVRDSAKRAQGVESVEKARDQFVKLADEFPGDLTLRAECLRNAAEAELALVGVRKEKSDEFRGTVKAAADLYRRLAEAVGPETTVGKQATAKADELMKDPGAVQRAAMDLYAAVSPHAGIPDLKAPPGLTPPPDLKVPAPGPVPPSSLVPEPPSVTPAPPPATKPAVPPPTGK